jgi:hypothetical protein
MMRPNSRFNGDAWRGYYRGLKLLLIGAIGYPENKLVDVDGAGGCFEHEPAPPWNRERSTERYLSRLIFVQLIMG